MRLLNYTSSRRKSCAPPSVRRVVLSNALYCSNEKKRRLQASALRAWDDAWSCAHVTLEGNGRMGIRCEQRRYF